MRYASLAIAAMTLTLVGCGGSGVQVGSGSTSTGIGSLKVEGEGVQSVSGFGPATPYGVTGNLQKATYYDTYHTLEDTEVVFADIQDNNGDSNLYAMSPDGTGRRLICELPGPTSQIQVNSAVNYVYFVAVTENPARNRLYRVAFSGGTPFKVLDDCTSFGLNPSGTKIMFRKSPHDGWWTSSSTGTGQVMVLGSTAYDLVKGFVSDTTIVAGQSNSKAASLISLDGTTLSGYSETDVKLHAGSSANGQYPIFSSYTSAGTGDYFLTRSASPFCSVPNSNWSINTGDLAASVGASPDGSMVVYSVADMFGTNVGLHTAGPGATPELIYQGSHVRSVAWSPYITSRTFIGSGTYAGGAGAILFSEKGLSLPAICLADAVTRTSCVLTRLSAQGDSNNVYRLDCDNLKTLHYSNVSNYNLTALITAPTGLKGAYISMDADTGKIASVVTFLKRPAEQRRGGRLHIEGDSLNQMLENGKEVSARGLRSIEL